jgi:hypothetical protein
MAVDDVWRDVHAVGRECSDTAAKYYGDEHNVMKNLFHDLSPVHINVSQE